MNSILKRELLRKLGYDPFNPEVPLSDIEDGDARSNPSKQLQTLLDAMRESGGWYNKPSPVEGPYGPVATQWQLNILSGPYTGCYQGMPGRPNLAYYPIFTPFLGDARGIPVMAAYLPKLHELQALNLACLRAAAKLRQSVSVSPDLRKALGFRVLRPWAETKARSLLKAITELQRKGDTPIQLSPHKMAAEQAGWSITVPASLFLAWLYSFKLPWTGLYILAKCSNTPIARVIADIEAEPRRILSWAHQTRWEVPTRARDRAKYSRVFLNTWSAQQAIKALFPNVAHALPALDRGIRGHEYDHARWLLTGVKEPKQVATLMSQYTPWETRTFLQERKVSKQDWVVLAEKLRSRKIKLQPIMEYVHRIEEMTPFLAGTAEGRRLIELAALPLEWPVLAKQAVQEHIDTLYDEYERSDDGQDDEHYLQWHQYGAKLLSLLQAKGALPRGVRITALTTRDMFANEGRTMHHCARGYFHQDESWLFHFEEDSEIIDERPSAPRATLELQASPKAKAQFNDRMKGRSPDDEPTPIWITHGVAIGSVRQFYGPSVKLSGDGTICTVCGEGVFESPSPRRARTCGNVTPSPKLLAALKQFRAAASQVQVRELL